jgi:hypothetical protein
MTEVRTVARQIQQLEIYLNNLVSALTRGELPVNLQPVTQIFDNAISAISPILNLSEDRFIELYNDIPQILTAYAIDVTLSGDSYRKINDNITFNRFHRGNYWIIPTQELIDRAWLVPNPLKNLSLDRMPSIYTSFDRDKITTENKYNSYFLDTPAIVQLLPIVEPLTWKLVTRGKITHNPVQKLSPVNTAIQKIYEQVRRDSHRQDKLLARQDRLLDDLTKANARSTLQDKEIAALKIQVASVLTAKDSIILPSLDRQKEDISLLQQHTENILKRFAENKPTLQFKQINIDSVNNISSTAATFSDDIKLSSSLLNLSELPQPHQEIISDYYHNPKEFASKYQVKIANITKDSINYNRGSEEKNIILEETNRGNYWIFNFGDDNYLVPVEDKYINQHSYTTTSTIFEGHNYTPDYHKIQLIRSAIVSIDPNTNPQTWRLKEQGELVFL